MFMVIIAFVVIPQSQPLWTERQARQHSRCLRRLILELIVGVLLGVMHNFACGFMSLRFIERLELAGFTNVAGPSFNKPGRRRSL
jgi:hypothetical protein